MNNNFNIVNAADIISAVTDFSKHDDKLFLELEEN